MFRVSAFLPLALVAFLAAISAQQASAGVLTDWTYGIATHYGGAQEGMNPVSRLIFRLLFFSLSLFLSFSENERGKNSLFQI